ncbi:TetR/AcrR family transcriptional regulator [Nocardia nova]|uniref:TetR/AcrR family transcriptional regulator n=1 Tax=Nocardia nova TaxID=37330 RepID=UPI0033EE4043
MPTASSRKGPGRPRDPDVEARTLGAAREVYRDKGWSGFTLDEVARRAGVGKSALYRRWPGKAALIIDAVRTQAPPIAAIDTGSLHDDLVAFATQWCRFVLSDDGAILARVSIEQRIYPEIDAAAKSAPVPGYIADTLAIARRGIERGELPPHTSADLIGSLVAGAMANHARTTPPDRLDETNIADFAETVVAVVLTGIRELPAR